MWVHYTTNSTQFPADTNVTKIGQPELYSKKCFNSFCNYMRPIKRKKMFSNINTYRLEVMWKHDMTWHSCKIFSLLHSFLLKANDLNCMQLILSFWFDNFTFVCCSLRTDRSEFVFSKTFWNKINNSLCDDQIISNNNKSLSRTYIFSYIFVLTFQVFVTWFWQILRSVMHAATLMYVCV